MCSSDLLLATDVHRERTNLRQIVPADLERADAEKLLTFRIDHKIAQVIIDGADRPGQHQALVRKAVAICSVVFIVKPGKSMAPRKMNCRGQERRLKGS